MYIYPENVKFIVVNLKEDVVKIFFHCMKRLWLLEEPKLDKERSFQVYKIFIQNNVSIGYKISRKASSINIFSHKCTNMNLG